MLDLVSLVSAYHQRRKKASFKVIVVLGSVRGWKAGRATSFLEWTLRKK